MAQAAQSAAHHTAALDRRRRRRACSRCVSMAFVPERARASMLASLRRELAPLLFALFIYLFLVDVVHNRLGSSNGKFISLVDTCRARCRTLSDGAT